MRRVTEEIYSRIDNHIYNSDEAGWWKTDSPLHLIKLLLNPVRINFITKTLFERLNVDPSGKNVLEVGCGGGILCEEISKMGFDTWGIDPSELSIKCAVMHAKENNLAITYIKGTGEALKFKNEYFDVVFCCDVLEHVHELPLVISEVSRVLNPGGIFIYDTINRTLVSKLVAIKILQECKRWAILPANLHVWDMFIRPDELKTLLLQNNLEWKEHRGIKPDIFAPKILRYLSQRAKGEISYEEFGRKFKIIEGCSLLVSYMGYALKKKD